MSRTLLSVLFGTALFVQLLSMTLAGETDVKTPEKPTAAPLPGHSLHGEAFDEGPRQKAYLMPGTGGVHFAVSTQNPRAQQFFDQGVGQLHGFWYFEAERSFRQVAMLDPDCAMAYWGMAMANTNNAKRAKVLIAKAVEKKASASVREQAWIDALSAWHAAADNVDRRRKYVQALETIVQDYPNDIEAKAFLAMQIWTNGSWATEVKANRIQIGSHQAVDAILDQVFAVAPMHPAHHYRIHLWDEEKAARALVSASLNGQASPSIAHMWHMPGHTYSKLHRYADAAWQQEAAARVDHAHMMRDGVLPDQIHNYAHNNEWLIRNLAYLGRVREGVDLAINMIELPRHPKHNNSGKGENSSNYGRGRLIDVLLQYERWNDLVAYSKTPLWAPRKDDADDRQQRLRVLGLAYFGLGKTEEGNQQITALDELLKEKRAARYKAADDAEAKARGEKKSEKDIAAAMASAMLTSASGIPSLERTLAELRTAAALAAGNQSEARAQLEKLKDTDQVSKEQHARWLLLAGDNAQAESLARKAVEKGPGEVCPLAVLVEVLHRVGKKDEARTQFDKLRPLAAHADLDQAVFQRLRPIAEEFGLPADWRGSREPAADVGIRPDLASLGPFRWQPTPATSWSVVSSEGQPLSLEQLRGKPVVMIYFLGSGCLHCVKQLHEFAPLAAEYQAAGIQLVGISTEPLDSLKGAMAKLTADKPIPFPLTVDPELGVFKAYRAYDDFEKMPLHATYLIDAEGLIRWHDVSFEPFTDARFLLDEAKRLMGRQ